MADTLDTYIKSPSPPKDPDSQYVYNEQQFGSLEKALRKHHDKILDVNQNATALYENEVNVRSTADHAIVQTIETLTAQFEASDTNTQGQIQNIQTALADAESSTASKLTTLEAKVDSGDATNLALIRDEAKTRSTSVGSLASKVSSLEASVKTGQAESRALVKQETTARADAVSAEATKRENLSAYVGYTDGQSYTQTLAASVSSEQSARVAADTAIAQNVISTSAGTSRVYSQSSAPSSSGRQTGDIWIDTTVPTGSTSPNLTPYVWYSGSWQNNSTGNYSQYAGLNATVTNLSTVVSDPTNGLAYQWAVKGTVGTDSLGNSALVLSGGRKPNGTGSWTDYSRIVMTASTIEMNGNVIINGTITNNQIATGDTNGIQTANLSTNCITGIASSTGNTGVVGTNLIGVGNASVLVIASMTGSVDVSASYVLDISVVVGTTIIKSVSIPLQSFAGSKPVSLGNFFVSTSNLGYYAYGPLTMWGFASSAALIPISAQLQCLIPSTYDGQTISFFTGVRQTGTSTYLNIPISLAVWQFKK